MKERRFRKHVQEQEEQEIDKLEQLQKSPSINKKLEWIELVKELRDDPSPKGTFPCTINGRVIDLHEFEKYVLELAPDDMQTVLSYGHSRIVNKMKGFDKLRKMTVPKK